MLTSRAPRRCSEASSWTTPAGTCSGKAFSSFPRAGFYFNGIIIHAPGRVWVAGFQAGHGQMRLPPCVAFPGDSALQDMSLPALDGRYAPSVLNSSWGPQHMAGIAIITNGSSEESVGEFRLSKLAK